MGRGAEPESIEKIIDFFNKRPEKWEIWLVGGEVTLHPQFTYLCQKLTEKHTICVTTNISISYERLKEFCNKINSNNVRYISCSLQPVDEEGERLTNFYNKIILLKNNQFKVLVTYVAAINRLDKIRTLKKLFEDSGVRFEVFACIQNEINTEKYTDEQKTLLDETIDAVVERYDLEDEAPQIVYGTKCDYGYTKVEIFCDTGDIKSCGRYTEKIGNIYTEENSTTVNISPSINIKKIKMPIVNWKKEIKLTSFRLDPPDNTEFIIKHIRILEDK